MKKYIIVLPLIVIVIAICGLILVMSMDASDVTVDYQGVEIQKDTTFITSLHKIAPLEQSDKANINDTFGDISIRIYCYDRIGHVVYSMYFYKDSHTYYYIYPDGRTGYGYVENLEDIITLIEET